MQGTDSREYKSMQIGCLNRFLAGGGAFWVVSLLETEVQEEEELVGENGDVSFRYVGAEWLWDFPPSHFTKI